MYRISVTSQFKRDYIKMPEPEF